MTVTWCGPRPSGVSQGLIFVSLMWSWEEGSCVIYSIILTPPSECPSLTRIPPRA